MRTRKIAVVPPRTNENNEVVINVEAFEKVIDTFNAWLKAYEDYITYKDAQVVEAIVESIELFLNFFVKNDATDDDSKNN